MQAHRPTVVAWRIGEAAPQPPRFGLMAPAIGRDPDGALTIATGACRVFVWTSDAEVRIADDPSALLASLRRDGTVPGFPAFALSHLLHHGFVPAPFTVYDGVLRLTFGDRVRIRPAGDRFAVEAHYEPIFRNARSREDSEPSTARLLELLVDAMQHALGDDSSVLMLSSGKDSVALALACREAGRDDVRAVTFASSADEGEAVDAAAFARRLGLAHEVVLLPDARAEIEPVVEAYFEHASEPCGDPTLVPYLLGVARAGARPGEALIDGLNNDSYVGYVPSKAEHENSRITDRWLSWARPLRGLFPCEHPASAALRTRAEWHFFGGRWLRHADTRRFYADSVDTHAEWARVSRERRGLDDFDFRSEVRGRHADQNAMIVKAYLAAEITGMRAVFPFTDPALTQYYFHLPEPSRFDRERLINKVLLRHLLRERLDYDDARIGKRTFHFDGPRFLTAQRSWVEHEITACPWWSPQVSPVVGRLLGRPDALAKTWPSLMALFQLSGWLNRRAELAPPR